MSEKSDAKSSADSDGEETHVPISRRGVLAAGSALGIALSAGTGSVGGSSAGGPVPASSPWNDEDGDGLLEPDAEFDGIDLDVLKTVPEETEPDIGVVGKELISQRDTTIHVDPAGDDDNDGSADSPVATIQEAVNRIPLFVLHDFTIDIADGEYTSDKESPAVHAGPFIVKGEADVNLYGNTDDPSAVYCDVGINWTGFGKLEHMRVHGIHWDFLSQFAGQADVRNCVFRGNGAAAISGKNGNVFFKRCDIGDPENDDFAVWGIQLERMYFDRCTIGATKYALNVFNGDIYQLSGRNTIEAPETFTMSGGAIATQGTDLYVGGEKK